MIFPFFKNIFALFLLINIFFQGRDTRKLFINKEKGNSIKAFLILVLKKKIRFIKILCI